MEKTKIAHMITDMDIGGAETMLLKILRNFKSSKYEHFVISVKQAGKIGKIVESEGFRVYSLGLNKYNFIPRFVRLLCILRREKPDILHSYLFHADLLGRIAGKLTRVPILISSLRSVDIGGRARENLLGITDFCVNSVTAVSKKAADVHIMKGTARREKLRVIYNGVEIKDKRTADASLIRRSMGIDDRTFILLTIGRLEEVKGHIFLFKALESLRVKEYKFKLLVVGRGKLEDSLKKEIIGRKLEENVILTGERDDIDKLLDGSDAFILPSLWEGLPNALLEAMTAGLPVIATRVGGVPELVDDNETGLLVEAKDSGALAEAIERIMKENGLSERLGRNARERVKNDFDIKNTVREISGMYEELLHEHKKN